MGQNDAIVDTLQDSNISTMAGLVAMSNHYDLSSVRSRGIARVDEERIVCRTGSGEDYPGGGDVLVAG